ncbi:hypothetical protein IFM89_035297 [Coptis chinensis]|uniref:Uncharacterized protein n=1 Tax=Coptis chinensis TaxID=261450 RepID=A0A835IGJ0_9MAGN|nr:hypothetical protein IFM89_035297 [Coptis chinensis]
MYEEKESWKKRIGKQCSNLQVLSIKRCPNVRDTSIAKIASACPILLELDISYCYEISHESLGLIGRKCLNLKILRRNLMNWLDPSQHLAWNCSKRVSRCLPSKWERRGCCNRKIHAAPEAPGASFLQAVSSWSRFDNRGVPMP